MHSILIKLLFVIPQTVDDWKLVLQAAIIVTLVFIFFILVRFNTFIKEQQYINDQYIKKMSEQYEKTNETD
jgi:c-di-AMP phosphodiesterase-like protein